MEWLNSIIEESKAEWNLNATRPSVVLSRNVRGKIWHACQNMNVMDYGVPGYACRLIEFYLAEQCRNFVDDNADENTWEPYKENLARNYPVTITAAIIISSKLHHNRPVDVMTASIIMRQDGFSNCSIENINNTEIEIMLLYDFTLPLWSNVHIGQLLGFYVGLPIDVVKFTNFIVNCSEFLFYKLNEDMNSYFFTNILGGCRIMSLHLAAASVYATSRYFDVNVQITLDRMTALINASELYIKVLSNRILYYIKEGNMLIITHL